MNRIRPTALPVAAVVLHLLLAPASLRAQVVVPPVPVPAGNPITPAKALLGKALFWDEQLSVTRSVACGTCHILEAGGADPRGPLAPAAATHPGFDGTFGTDDDVLGSPGVVRNDAAGAYLGDDTFGLRPQVTPRRAPSVINSAFPSVLFWDGRAGDAFHDPVTGDLLLPAGAALETQAASPPVSPVEMGHEGIAWPDVVARLPAAEPLALADMLPPDLEAGVVGRTYAQLFEAAFGSPEVTPARVVMALATYQRTLVSDRARIDNFPVGFTIQEHEGGDLFDVHCAKCHPAPMFTNETFRNIGLRPPHEDKGLGAITGDPADDGRFRVPSLRNVSLRTSLMHDGRFRTLAEVLEFYDRGGDFEENQDPFIEPLDLSAKDKEAIIAYLLTFTDKRVALGEPPFDRPRLWSERAGAAPAVGEGTVGTGNRVPRFVALQPASLVNDRFTVGLSDALGGRPAVLVGGLELAPDGLEVLGARLWIDVRKPFFARFTGELPGDAPGAGFTSFVWDVSTLPADAVGLRFYAQWIVSDPGAPTSFYAMSEAVEFTVF